MKKYWSFLLTALLLFSLQMYVFARGEEERTMVSADFPDAGIVNPTGFPITKETITISVFAQRGEQYAERAGWEWLEKIIKIKKDYNKTTVSNGD